MIESNAKCTAEPIRVTQVEDQVSALDVNSEDLRRMIDTLESSLSSIVSPIPEKNPAPATPRPVLVPLATSLQNICDAIRSSVDRLREINARIELPSRNG